MRDRKLTLSIVLAGGMFLYMTPAWAQSSPSSTDRPHGSQLGGSEGLRDSGTESLEGRTRTDKPGIGQQADIKKAQEALKEKGFDPGPIDGVLGPHTREALRSFQKANNLKATGRLDNETAKQLGIEHASDSGMGARSGQKSGSREGSGSSEQSGKSSPGSQEGSGGSSTSP